MICPRCGQVNQGNVKFCAKCGNQMQVQVNTSPQGMGNQETQILEEQGIGGTIIQNNIATGNVSHVPPGLNVPPVDSKNKGGHSGNSKRRKRVDVNKKGNTSLIIVASLLGGILLIVAVLLVLMATGTIGSTRKEKAGTQTEEDGKSGKGEESTQPKPEQPKPENKKEASLPDDTIKDMLDPVDQQVEDAKDECDSAEINELDDGLEMLQESIASYIEIGKQCGDSSKVEDKVYDTYELYRNYTEDSIGQCKSAMDGCLGEQPGAGYGTYFELMVNFYTNHIGVATYMKDQEYNADPDGIEADFKADRTDYIASLIERFNLFTELTSSKTWSRTECWTLMETIDPQVMFLAENSDDALNDPVYLRYVWAAAYNKQKTAETNVSSGEWTAKHAADSIREDMESLLYCPFLVQEYVGYASKAGIDCRAQMAALKQCEQLLMAEQGIAVGSVKDGWKLIWFFNDFGQCTSNGVDTMVNIVDGNRNGIRQDVREQIIGILASSFAQ